MNNKQRVGRAGMIATALGASALVSAPFIIDDVKPELMGGAVAAAWGLGLLGTHCSNLETEGLLDDYDEEHGTNGDI
jgi:hypothetical protein